MAGRKSHLAIGIHAEGEFARLAGEVAAVAGDTAPRGERGVLYPIAPGGGGLADYFFDYVTPFYDSSWSERLNNTFGAGRA